MSLGLDFLVYNCYNSTYLWGIVMGLNEFMYVKHSTLSGM